MELRLHRGGRFRRWLGTRFGGDEQLGDRLWRRCLHGIGAAVLLYYAIPDGFFVVLSKQEVLVLALAAVVLLEVLRHGAGLELPTLRPYEEARIGSYVFYALALAGAVLLFPRPIAAAVVLGTAFVDPLAGELRASARWHRTYPVVPALAYAALAFVGLAGIGDWPAVPAAGLALIAAPLAVASEWPKIPWIDDDLAMTFVPAIVLYLVGGIALGLPGGSPVA